MKILSIDTSSKICAVAVIESLSKKDNKVISEISLDNGLTHSQTLMPTIKKVLEDSGLQLQDIDLIVCDKGPGSFTGIRIGVATAKAFYDSLNIQIIGVNSLETLAYNIKNDGIIVSLIDAKHESAYWSVYERKDGEIFEKKSPGADEIHVILNEIEKYSEQIIFVGDGAINYKEQIAQGKNYIISSNNDISAVNLAIAGVNHYGENEELLPLYIKKPQAERG